MTQHHSPRIAFFGTPELALPVLNTLADAGLSPTLVITAPDRPVGRKQLITPPPVKTWAEERTIPVIQPEATTDPALLTALHEHDIDLSIVFAYGYILPTTIIENPTHGTLNLHPSLLPQLRGPSPIRSAILRDIRPTGVTIMQMDDQMDHGPILAQRTVTIPDSDWPPYGPELDTKLIEAGATLLAETIPHWCRGAITPTPQDHDQATYCHKLTKADGELALDPHDLPSGSDAHKALRTIRGLAGWPEAFFIYNGQRIKIHAAHIDENDTLRPTRITPAGKGKTGFSDYLRSHVR